MIRLPNVLSNWIVLDLVVWVRKLDQPNQGPFSKANLSASQKSCPNKPKSLVSHDPIVSCATLSNTCQLKTLYNN